MKNKMKKKEIKKIEDNLSDIDVPDSVLNLAQTEMAENDKVQKPAVRKFNFKIALSCAASFALCLAIILPITLSSFNRDGNGIPDNSSADINNSDDSSADNNPDNSSADIINPDNPSADISGGETTPPASSASPYYKLEDLIPDISADDHMPSDSEPKPPEDPDDDPTFDSPNIKSLSQIKYTDGNITIISKETYAVYGKDCTVYTLYDTSFKIDILEQFENFTDEYSVGNVKVKYKINDGNYLAEAFFSSCRYCFTGSFSGESVFETFCQYLFQ